MTRKLKSSSKRSRIKKTQRQAHFWPLQNAKARFSELVRRVHRDGPQHVTVHGREEVVVVSSNEFRRLKGEHTGTALLRAMQASPHRDTNLTAKRPRLPIRPPTEL